MPEPTIPEYLSYATQNHASDIFIIAGRPLSVKIDGKLSGHGERLMPDDTAALIREIYHMAGERNFDRFLETGDDDFSFSIPGDFPDSVSMPIKPARFSGCCDPRDRLPSFRILRMF